MKKIKFFSLIITFMMLIFTSCETVDPSPDCEQNSYGTVIVKNSTGYAIIVDVTEGSSEYNDERYLSNGGRTTYYKIDAGNIRVWGSFDGDSWNKNSHYLTSCEEYTFTWYLNKKSNSIENVWLEISKNGEVIEIVKDVDIGVKNLQ